MAALLHFIFELLKIGVLSTIYGSVILLVIWIKDKIISANKKSSKEMTYKTWMISIQIIYSILFIYMFTYWGNHGLGDDSYLPIGHFKTVYQSDGSFTYLHNKNGNQLIIEKFTYDDNFLYATVIQDSNGQKKGDHLVWNLKTDDLQFYTTNFPAIPRPLHDFNEYYSRYWNGWRFWLLP